MGDTNLSQEEVHALILKMGQEEYKGNRYHLLQRNCNHFASDVVYQLTGLPAPSWVRLTRVARSGFVTQRAAFHCRLWLEVCGEHGRLVGLWDMPPPCSYASTLCSQVNRLAGLAVMLHCLLPNTWVPPLQNPECELLCDVWG
jgi:hypothetical protein